MAKEAVERRDENLVARVTALFFEHDPAQLREGNPDLPADEYGFEAEEVLRRLGDTRGDHGEVISLVTSVFVEEMGGHSVSRERLQRVGRDLHALLERPPR